MIKGADVFANRGSACTGSTYLDSDVGLVIYAE